MYRLQCNFHCIVYIIMIIIIIIVQSLYNHYLFMFKTICVGLQNIYIYCSCPFSNSSNNKYNVSHIIFYFLSENTCFLTFIFW